MKIFEPKENINGIISLVENAKEFVEFVSPYSYLEGWDKLKQAINRCSSRGVRFSYYVRQGEGDKGLEGLNAQIFEVPMLHAKMFFNENEGIISSFHLMNNRDINWAFKITDANEYKELINYFNRCIKPSAIIF